MATRHESAKSPELNEDRPEQAIARVKRRLKQRQQLASRDIETAGADVETSVEKLAAAQEVADRLTNAVVTMEVVEDNLRKRSKVRLTQAEEGAREEERSVDVGGTWWSLSELREWLGAQDLEGRLEGGSLEYWIRRAIVAYGDGPWGFRVRPDRIRFDASRSSLHRLKAGIEMGVISGAVVEAYPSEEEVQRIALFGAATRREALAKRDTLLELAVMEFLGEHFVKRGGLACSDPEYLAALRSFRWPNSGAELPERFRMLSAARNLDPTAWLDDRGQETTDEFLHLHRNVYEDLPPQRKLKELLGSATLSFIDTRENVPVSAPVLRADGSHGAMSQGVGLSSLRLLLNDMPAPTPTQIQALFALADPKRVMSYPDPTTWEWTCALADSYVVTADSLAGEQHLGLAGPWSYPENSRSDGRVRAVAP